MGWSSPTITVLWRMRLWKDTDHQLCACQALSSFLRPQGLSTQRLRQQAREIDWRYHHARSDQVSRWPVSLNSASAHAKRQAAQSLGGRLGSRGSSGEGRVHAAAWCFRARACRSSDVWPRALSLTALRGLCSSANELRSHTLRGHRGRSVGVPASSSCELPSRRARRPDEGAPNRAGHARRPGLCV